MLSRVQQLREEFEFSGKLVSAFLARSFSPLDSRFGERSIVMHQPAVSKGKENLRGHLVEISNP